MDIETIKQQLIAEGLEPLTLDQFIANEIAIIKSFENYWIANHQSDPERFPLLADEGTWLEMRLYYDGDVAQAKVDALIDSIDSVND